MRYRHPRDYNWHRIAATITYISLPIIWAAAVFFAPVP